MKKLFSPMLASALPADVDLKTLPYPLYASFKLDGIRATKQEDGGHLISRNFERIPNEHVQKLFKMLPEGFDGELGCGDPTAPDFFRKTMSAVMSSEGTPDITYYIFGKYDSSYTFEQRWKLIQQWYRMYHTHKIMKHIQVLPQTLVSNVADLEEFEKLALKFGYEGVMLAKPDGKYKQGRSTLREFYLVKLKRFAHGEAKVIGVEELMHNDNEKLAGKSRKQTLKQNLRPAGTLGALVVQDLKTKVQFNIGTGFDDATRHSLWQCYMCDSYCYTLLGKIVRYKYFPTGSKDKPRFPVFDGFRDKRDL